MSQLKDYLEKLSEFIRNSKMKTKDYYYQSFEEFVLKNGQEFKSQKLTEEERKIVMGIIDRNFLDCKVKECYKNAQLLAIESDGKIQYVEGFAFGVIPIPHAWNLINGKVIDLTWCNDGNLIEKDRMRRNKRKENIILGEFYKEEYFGVIFSIEEIRKNMLKKEMFTSIIDNWEEGYPLLKSEFKLTEK